MLQLYRGGGTCLLQREVAFLIYITYNSRQRGTLQPITAAIKHCPRHLLLNTPMSSSAVCLCVNHGKLGRWYGFGQGLTHGTDDLLVPLTVGTINNSMV